MIKKIYMFLYKNFIKIPEPVRYFLVGGFNTVFGIFLYQTLFYLFGNIFNYLVIYYFSSFISITVSIFTLKYYVFLKEGDFKKQFIKTFSMQIILMIITSGLMALLVEILRINPMYAQPIATIIVAILGYFIHKSISFK